MGKLLERLFCKEVILKEFSTLNIKALGLKKECGKNLRAELLMDIAIENKKLEDLLIIIEEEIELLIAEELKEVFLLGISYGQKIGIKFIENKAELTETYVDVVEFYNTVKKSVGLIIVEKVSNSKEVLWLNKCSKDDFVDRVIDMFYDSKMTFNYILESKDKYYCKKFLKLIFLENEFASELSDYTKEKFYRYVRCKNQHNNEILANTYFNGFAVGANIVKQLDNISLEIENINKNE